ncbi:MAG: hypothetical protein IJ727_09040 [Treponema sp.]|nr:hypothetical protein [Treponema sp.]
MEQVYKVETIDVMLVAEPVADAALLAEDKENSIARDIFLKIFFRYK